LEPCSVGTRIGSKIHHSERFESESDKPQSGGFRSTRGERVTGFARAVGHQPFGVDETL
jgi:hypothetical protein